MEFALSEEQAMIADTARAFFAEQATSERTRAAMADGSGLDPVLWQRFCRELGLAGVMLPESHGGAGLGLTEAALVAEAAGAQLAALPYLASLGLAAPAIRAGGSDAQRARWLNPLARGDSIATLVEGAFTVSDQRVTGTGPLVPHGGSADLFVVRCADGVVLLVERGAPGVTVRPMVTMDQTRPYARVDFAGSPGEPLEDGRAALAAAYQSGWVLLAADAVGGAQSCLDRTVAYAKERVQFGRPIGSFQAVKHRLADMVVELEQARSSFWWAAFASDEGAQDARLAAHAAKAFACDTYLFCAGAMIQLHGGIGFTWEHDAHLFFKRARANASLLGTSEWHREQVAQLVGLEAA